MADQWVAGRDHDPSVGAALGRTGGTLRRWTETANRAADGLWVDLALYGLSTVFAAVTIGSNLPAHGAWGRIAVGGYAVATGAVVVLLVWWSVHRRAPLLSRALLTVAAWLATTLLPLIVEAVQRSAGRSGRAQEEVTVIEAGGERLWHTGTPFLDRATIASHPPAQWLFDYLPYQPGMAVFGVPRALHSGWFSDARIWFFIVTAAALGIAVLVLRRAGIDPAALIRAVQAATVLPICALTLATGGDDLPVLALCLLAFALATTGRLTGSGFAIGLAASLKLFAWPVLVILGVHALTQRRIVRYTIPALALPVLTALPALLINSSALVENVFGFPFGRGLVSTPAASPLPGHLIATGMPGGRIVTLVLLAAAAGWIMVELVRHPPRTAAAAARLSAWSLLAATLLLPATRFGYLLYPVAFFVWAPALRPRPIPAPRLAPEPS